MNSIVLRSKAKINLTLDVVGKRDNGYHDLRMIMQTINLYDTIKIRKTKAPGIRMQTNLVWLPKDDRNIAYKAAALFIKEAGIEKGVYIHIHKRIPIAAGLAGGSSNAAAVLVGMNKLFGIHYTEDRLMELGLKLGADVPFCIKRGTVLAEGIGEELTPLKALPYTYILLAKPNVSVSTAKVYGTLRYQEIEDHPKTDEIVEAINNDDKQFVINNMRNVLEDVTTKEHPEIVRIKEQMMEMGAQASMMSGSGPTVFGVFKTREACIKAAKYFRYKAGLKEVHVTSTYYPKHYNANLREGTKDARRKFKY